ncbi:MAG: C25 family cysteine peptidase [Candidatus Cloacimonadia bacterium]
MMKMVRTCLTFAFVLLFWTLYSQPNIRVIEQNDAFIDLELRLDEYALETVDLSGKEFHKVKIEGAQNLSEEGEPELPAIVLSLIVPNCGTVNLQSFSIEETDVYNDITVLPSNGLDGSTVQNLSLTSQQTHYPNAICEISSPQILRDYRYVSVAIRPFEYDISRSELKVVKKIRLRLAFDSSIRGENELNKTQQKVSKSFAKVYQSIFANYKVAVERSNNTQQRSLLIIHHHNQTITPIIEQMTDWKREKGFTVHTVDTKHLETAYAIKGYIQEAFDTWESPPEYVLIVGGGSGSFAIPYFSGYEDKPSDHPYTLLAGDDDIPDVFIGRISVYNLEQLMTVWNKIKLYEKSPYLVNTDWYTHTLLVGDPDTSGTSTISISKYVKELILESFPDYEFSEVYEPPFASKMNAALNRGVNFFSYRGYINMSSWSPKGENLSNGLKLPNCFFLTCNTLSYDGNSAAERMVVLGTPTLPKGGVSAIGTTTAETKTAFNNAFIGSMMSSIYADGIRTMGEALLIGKVYLHQVFDFVHPDQTPQFTHWTNLVGDPSLDFWVDVPKKMTAIFERSIPYGQKFIDVTVNDADGLPLNDACVTGYNKDDSFSVTGYTDKEGKVTLFWNTELTDGFTLTVTKPDYIPAINSLQIEADKGVFLFEKLLNEEPEAGKTIPCIPLIKNYLPYGVDAIYGELSTDDKRVVISQNRVNFGSILPNETKASDSPFIISFDNNMPDNTAVLFNLEVSDGNERWLSKLELMINGANLQPKGVIVNGFDEFIKPGDTEVLQITVENIGKSDVNDVYGILNTESDFVEIQQPLSFFGEIKAGETKQSSPSDPFIIKVSEEVIPGMRVDFKLLLFSNEGFESIRKISLRVGEIKVTDPLGPDSFGHFIYGQEDTAYELCPEYEWYEIAPQHNGEGIDTGLESDWNNIQQTVIVDLPFPFVFYGKEYDKISICANGWISFGVTEQTTFRNWIIPGPLCPKPMIAAFWDNLNVSNGGVYTHYDTEEQIFIIQWQNAKNIINAADETFQIILYNPQLNPEYVDGLIKIQYKTFNNINNSKGTPDGNWGNYCSVGIVDHTGKDGLQYTFANKYSEAASELSDRTSLLIVGPKKVDQTPFEIVEIALFDENDSGYVDAGESIKLGICIRNSGRAEVSNVVGTLTSLSPYVSIVKSNASYSDMASGEVGVNKDFFEFTASSATPDGYLVDFTLELATVYETIELELQIPIYKSTLSFKEYLIFTEPEPEGRIEAGEAFEIAFNWENKSKSDAENTTVNLKSSHNYLQLHHIQEKLGNIQGETIHQSKALFFVDKKASVNDILSFVIEIESANTSKKEYEISLLVGEMNRLFDFEEDDGLFISNDISGWQWGELTLAGKPNNKGWGTVLEGDYKENKSWTLDSPDIVIPPKGTLTFLHFYRMEEYWDGGNVKLSVDGGNNWHIITPNKGYPTANINSGNVGIPNQPAFSGNSEGWERVSFNLDRFEGKVAKFRWHFGSGHWVNDQGWYVDEVEVSGAKQDNGCISGRVIPLNENELLRNIGVCVGDYIVTADDDGYYSMIIPAGEYDVEVYTPYYWSDLVHHVKVGEFEKIVELDFNVRYVPPATDLRCETDEEAETLTLYWEYYTEDNSVQDSIFNVYRQINSGRYERIYTTDLKEIFDTLPVNDDIHRYYVTAVYKGTESDKSNVVSTDDFEVNIREINLPSTVELYQNYPNPFNPSTKISFSLPAHDKVTLEIYNIKGAKIKTLIKNEMLNSGSHTYEWEGNNDSGMTSPSGVYFFKLSSRSNTQIKKGVLLK